MADGRTVDAALDASHTQSIGSVLARHPAFARSQARSASVTARSSWISRASACSASRTSGSAAARRSMVVSDTPAASSAEARLAHYLRPRDWLGETPQAAG